MKKDELTPFLNEDCRVLFDVGANKLFQYHGNLLEVTDTNLILMDKRSGRILLDISRVAGISILAVQK